MAQISIEVNIEEVKWQKELPDVERIIEQACITALQSTGITRNTEYIEISVLLANDKTIQNLNGNYRGKDKPTNVLSFPQEELVAGKYRGIAKNISLGDIIFALETIQKEATEQNKTFHGHLVHLAVHGTLHLIGYDHQKKAEAEIMEALEIGILDKLGIASPY